jgi:16S rRNA (cytosine967-C5)-methyltransferase
MHPASVRELYVGVRGLAVKILSKVERTDTHLDKLLEHELRANELSGPDKSLLYEIVHGVIRWSGRLDWILSGFYKGQFSKAIPIVKNVLRVALYQILFLEKVPEYAAVNEAVEFVKKLQGQKPADITNAVLRNIIRNKNNLRYPDPSENLIGYLATYYSHPAWMIKRWLSRYGRTGTEALLLANNERPAQSLRLNEKKMSVQEFKTLFDSLSLKYHQGSYLQDFFKAHSIPSLSQWQYFTNGYFTVQDESAGLACRLLNPRSGMRVLDICAAPGGKSAYIGQLMNNTGTIVTVDRFEARLRLLAQTLDRLGITIYETHAIDALEFEAEPFDAILCDVPCSGFGTLSKKPDIKWKKELIDIRRLADLQLQILNHAAELLKPGGVLVYSTCTIEPEENIEVVNAFLAGQPKFKLEHASAFVPAAVVDENCCVQTLPHVHKTDGAFAARLLKFS